MMDEKHSVPISKKHERLRKHSVILFYLSLISLESKCLIIESHNFIKFDWQPSLFVEKSVEGREF